MAKQRLRIADAKTGREIYRARPVPTSRWRCRARDAISSIIETTPAADSAALLKLVDAAYPFGERSHHPYKAWLAERAQLVADLEAEFPPSSAEWGAVEVAIDLVEGGRIAEARALLEEQAPNRHARPCSVCGVRAGHPCREAVAATFAFQPFDALGHAESVVNFTDRLIPHAARVQP